MPARLWITSAFAWPKLAEVLDGLSPESAGQNWQVQPPISWLDIGDPLRGDGDFVAFG